MKIIITLSSKYESVMTTRQHSLIKTLKISLINIHFIMESFFSIAINKFSGAGDYSINTSPKEKFVMHSKILSSGNWSVDVQVVNNRSNWKKWCILPISFNLIEVIKFDESFYSASNKWFVLEFFEKTLDASIIKELCDWHVIFIYKSGWQLQTFSFVDEE